MKGYTVIELIVAMVVLFFAVLILFASVDQANRIFSKAGQDLNSAAKYFMDVTSNFAGQTSGNRLNTLNEVLGYQLSGAYVFFDSIEVRIKDGRYVYALEDITF